jgi:hypothetical protein
VGLACLGILPAGFFLLSVFLCLLCWPSSPRMFGWFGPGLRGSLHSFGTELSNFHRDHKGAIEWVVWIIGIGGSVATAVLTVHRSWYYAELNLPSRIRERIERTIRAHLNVRPALMATVNDPVAPSSFVTPIVHIGYFNWVMKSLGLGRARAMARTLANSLDDLKTDIGIVTAKKRELETQAITAHLLRGARLAGQAALEEPNSPERRSKSNDALQEFLAALQLDGNDLDALETRG